MTSNGDNKEEAGEAAPEGAESPTPDGGDVTKSAEVASESDAGSYDSLDQTTTSDAEAEAVEVETAVEPVPAPAPITARERLARLRSSKSAIPPRAAPEPEPDKEAPPAPAPEDRIDQGDGAKQAEPQTSGDQSDTEAEPTARPEETADPATPVPVEAANPSQESAPPEPEAVAPSRAMVPVAPAPSQLASPPAVPASDSLPDKDRRAAPKAAVAQLPARASAAAQSLPAKLGRRRSRRMSSSRAALLSMTSQEAPLAEQSEERDVLLTVEHGVMRLASIAWLAAAVLIWGRIVGFVPTDLALSWHQLDGPWLPMITAAIVAPTVAVGLWLTASWGAVIWATVVLLGITVTTLNIANAPLGPEWIWSNFMAVLVVGGLAGARAWRDREPDD